MDQLIIESKLDSLYRCIKRLKEKTPREKEKLLNDIDLQDIIAVNLVRAVQIAVDIGAHIIAKSEEPPPSNMGQAFTRLETLQIISTTTAKSMRSAVGFRNISVHSYDDIDWDIVWSIITLHIDDFRKYASEVSHYYEL